MNMRDATLCYLIRDDQILLGLKKRGFAEGILNGYGGKVMPGEAIEAAMIREISEECSVVVAPMDLEKVAVIDFYFADSPRYNGWEQKVHVFLARNWKGEPIETEEMSPVWYRFSEIPYDNMWADDTEWLPLVLSGKKVRGSYYFMEDGKTIEKRELKLSDGF